MIRGSSAPPRSVVPGEVFDAREDAERILVEAREEAERLRAAAREDASAAREKARAEGFAQGRAEAAALLLEARRIRDDALAGAERDARSLALAAARRIVGEELRLAPERIVAIVGELLERARRAREVRVRVHPDDATTLGAAKLAASVRVIGDASIERGGCVVETDLGELDARVEVQLRAIASALGCEAP